MRSVGRGAELGVLRARGEVGLSGGRLAEETAPGLGACVAQQSSHALHFVPGPRP
ncbi:hypothetical protein [Streptomyces sp. NPDC003327]